MAADAYTFNVALEKDENEFIFSNRQYVWISDQNSGNYPNGQIQFDLSSLSNSGKIIDFQQSFLTIPLVLNIGSFTGTAPTASAENVFAASLKNSFLSLINSLSLEISNNQVINLTAFSNLDIHYRLLSTMDFNTYQNFGASINFCKDTPESINYQGGATSSNVGIGECNNNIKSSLFAADSNYNGSIFTQNAGRLERMKNTSFDINGVGAVNYTTTSNLNIAGKNYCVQNGTNITYYILATIPLKCLHDIFTQLPLSKGIYCRLVINTHAQSSCVVTVNANKYTSFTSSSPNNIIPFMLSPLSAAGYTGNGLALNAATTGFTVSLGIGKSTSGTITHPTMSQCRVYSCCYEFSPIFEEMYFTKVPVKKILYDDILVFPILNVPSLGNFSQILSNGVSRARYLLIVPQLSSTINGGSSVTNTTFAAGAGTTQAGAYSPMNSPFSSSPCTCAPYAFVNNFNVLVSGTTIYQENYNYRFQNFLQEFRSSRAINGGVPINISSGLLNQNEYDAGYNYIYVNLSRRASESSADISRSIQVQGTNNSNVSIDYYCIIGYQREINLSTATGSLVIDNN